MINEHDIADMMDQTFKAMPEEKKKVEFITEGEDAIMDLRQFLTSYTEALLGLLKPTMWHIKEPK